MTGDIKAPRLLRWYGWRNLAFSILWIAVWLALVYWLRWNQWLAFLAAFGIMVAVQVAFLVAADIRPRKVPADFAGAVARIESAGYRQRRYHPWLCTEKKPHIHMIAPRGGDVIVIFTWGEKPS